MTKSAEVYADQLVRALEERAVVRGDAAPVSVSVNDITINLTESDYQRFREAFAYSIAAAYEDGRDHGYNAGVEKGYRNCYEEGAQLYE
jgi:flagellar biosynthesis/type III secretory pathway protein FliH